VPHVDFSFADISKSCFLDTLRLNAVTLVNTKLPYYEPAIERGSFDCFKKLEKGYIAELHVPSDAGRVCDPMTRNVRVSKVKVLSIMDRWHQVTHAYNMFSEIYGRVLYRVEKMVEPDKFDFHPFGVHGIHVFLTRREAEDF
jgi:hypothetical protein